MTNLPTFVTTSSLTRSSNSISSLFASIGLLLLFSLPVLAQSGELSKPSASSRTSYSLNDSFKSHGFATRKGGVIPKALNSNIIKVTTDQSYARRASTETVNSSGVNNSILQIRQMRQPGMPKRVFQYSPVSTGKITTSVKSSSEKFYSQAPNITPTSVSNKPFSKTGKLDAGFFGGQPVDSSKREYAK